MDIDRLLAHADFVRHVAQGILRDRHLAEDAAQETLLRALRSGPRQPEALRGWLRTVAANAARMLRRSETRRATRERAAARGEATTSTGDRVAERALRREIASAVLELDEPLRSVLLLRYFEGCDFPEIAARQGITAEGARRRHERGLAALRRRFRRSLPALALFAFSKRAAAAALLLATASTGVIVAHGAGDDTRPRAVAARVTPPEKTPMPTAQAPQPPADGPAGSPPAPPPPPIVGDATVSGRVVDPAGVPVPGAYIVRIDGDNVPPVVPRVSTRIVARSRPDGTFQAFWQPSGSFFLVADFDRHLGFGPGSTTEEPLDTTRNVNVVVASGGVFDGVELRVEPRVVDCVHVRGVVADEEGRPIRSAVMRVGEHVALSDGDGRFDAGLFHGERPVSVTAIGYHAWRGSTSRDLGRVVLERADVGSFRLEGVVRGRQGAPLGDAWVSLEAAAPVRVTWTDASGRFAFRDLPPCEDELRLRVSAAAHQPSNSPVALGEFVEVDLEPASVIELDVHDADGRPVLNYGVVVDGSYIERFGLMNGKLDVSVPYGTSTLVVSARGYRSRQCPLDLTPEQTRVQLSVTLERAD